MESINSSRRDGKKYGSVLLALLATAVLGLVPFLKISPVGTEAEMAAVVVNALLGSLLTLLLMAIVPSLWAYACRRTQPLWVAVLTAVLLAVSYWATEGDWTVSLCTVGMVLIPSVGMIILQNRRGSNFQVVAYGALLLLIGFGVRVCLPSLLKEGDSFAAVRAVVDAYYMLCEPTLRSAAGILLQEEAVELLLDTVVHFRTYAELYVMMYLYEAAAGLALCNGLLVHAFNRKQRVDLVALPPFREWRVERGYFYGSSALLAVSLVLYLCNVSAVEGLLNVMTSVWSYPLMLAGLCACRRIAKDRVWLFIIVCVAVVTLPYMASILSAIGLFSTISDIRKAREEQGGAQ